MAIKVSALTEKTIEPTDQLIVSGDGAIVSNKVLASDFLPITESVTKTVAADGMPSGVQDFDDFHTAMTWACSQNTNKAKIELLLEDGVHYIGGPDTYDEDLSGYYIITSSLNIYISGASGNEAAVIITFPNTPTPAIRTIFNINKCAFAGFLYLTIDPSYGGLTNFNGINILAQHTSTIYLRDITTRKASYGLSIQSDSYMFSRDSVTVEECEAGVHSYRGSLIYFEDIIINNCIYFGLYCIDSSVINCAGSITFSGNPSDSNSPFNEIQPDGSYITDNTTPLVISDSFGTTAERPDPVNDGFNYFDSDLDKPLWWNGTEWLEGSIPITESVTKTVAADGMPSGVQDFDTFHEAMTWACKQLVSGTALVLSLEDGTHYIGPDEIYNSEWGCYYAVTNGSMVQIESASGEEENCIITAPSGNGNAGGRFFMSRVSRIVIQNVTIDCGYGGNTNPYIAIACRTLGAAYLSHVNLTNTYQTVWASENSYIHMQFCIITNCYVGAYCYSDAFVNMYAVELNNCSTEGIHCRTSSRVIFEEGSFSGNTKDTNIPLNTIQPDGSYITDGTEELIPYPITESVTKTVAADGDPAGVMDFDDFDTAMKWAINQTTISSEIILSLEDGTHYTALESPTSYYMYEIGSGLNLKITSTSEDASLCTITYPPTAALNSIRTITAKDGGNLYISYITMDQTFGGESASEYCTAIAAVYNGKATIRYCTITNFYRGCSGESSSYLWLWLGVTISNCTLEGIKLHAAFGQFTDVTLSNNLSGISVYAKGQANLFDITFSSNTDDTNIPLNTIQKNGTYISDGTVPLIQADSVGTTAERPDPVMPGFSHFDSDRDAPAWWNGSEWKEGSIPITESVTKTVAADGMPAGVQDFDDFHTAMTWACSQVTQGCNLTLELEDGIHYVQWTPGDNWFYNVSSLALIVKSNSGDKSLCTVTPRSLPTDADWKTMFAVTSAASLFLQNITFDGTAGGYLYTTTLTCCTAYESASLYPQYFTIQNFYSGVTTSGQSYLEGWSPGTIDNCNRGLSGSYYGKADCTGWTISNCTTAVRGSKTTKLYIKTFTLTSNVDDTNYPLNTMLEGGGFISDNTTPLVMSESFGTTAERPTARQIGHAYFDTTLGYSINWDGTNWVDSTGTTV